MRFRAKIFLAILVPGTVLVTAAAAAALLEIRANAERAAGEGLARTNRAFAGVLGERLEQLRRSSAPFEGTRFDAAISAGVESGDLTVLKELLGNEFLYLQHTPEFYEIWGLKDARLLLRHSSDPACGPACPHPFQTWIARREAALTEFDGRPFMAIRIRHEQGFFVFGTGLKRYLDDLHRSFGVELALTRGDKVVYSSLPGWTPAVGSSGPVHVNGLRYLAARVLPENSELDLVALLFSMREVDERKARVMLLGAGGLALAVVIAGLVSVRLSRGISRPVETLVEATRRVGSGDYTAKVDLRSRDEMGLLGAAFNDMTEGLRKRREIMEKTLSRDVAEELMKGVELGGERREVTILFTDIRGFTSATEGVDPADVVAMLNGMMARLAEAIARHGGNVNKYLGDGLMAMFGAPRDLDDHAFHAVQAAREMQRETAAWNAERGGGGPPLGIGVGINTGVVVGGKVGSERRLEYTLIGEEVNLTSRVCGKASPGQILVTRRTRSRLKDRVRTRALDPVQVKGLSYPVEIFEVEE